MKVRSVGQSKTTQGRSTTLVPGQLVHGRVITKISPGFFRVGAGGQVFIAESELPLFKGQKLTARVESGGGKVFLRIFEDETARAARLDKEIDTNEIVRVLKGLGYSPDQMEIIEFRERLDRCRQYGYFPGAEPSDVWILAILWTKGLKSGADAFALLSFYLRQAGRMHVIINNHVKLAEFLTFPHDDPSPIEEDATAETTFFDTQLPDNEADYHRLRTIEAGELINRTAEQNGRFTHSDNPEITLSALYYHDAGKRQGRWIDNPSTPQVMIEAVEAQGVIRSRIHCLQGKESSSNDILDRWQKSWEANVRRFDWELESHEVSILQDPEILRFMFWRIWKPEQVRNITA